ncbi:MAG: OmpA family protein [Myxococcales bacterium]|nr:OmpA family protein [Myxococcales bacterium]
MRDAAAPRASAWRDRDAAGEGRERAPHPAAGERDRGSRRPDPDPDGDGFVGADDECPDEQGIEPAGCPLRDGDGDGILDPDDQCLEACEVVNGVADDDGCPDAPARSLARLEEVLGPIPALRFEINKWTIHSSSFASLDNVVAVMQMFPETRFAIEGHSDSKGGRFTSRVRISRKRAEAVRQYVVSKGVEASRLETRDYGEDKPIAPNSTAEGRAQNRRIEITLLGDAPVERSPCSLPPAVQDRAVAAVAAQVSAPAPAQGH